MEIYSDVENILTQMHMFPVGNIHDIRDMSGTDLWNSQQWSWQSIVWNIILLTHTASS